MSDPSLAVQGEIFSLLLLADVAGGRVYDRVPPAPTFPYVTIGDGESIGDDNQCGQATRVRAEVHVWSQAPGWPEAKALAGFIRGILTDPLELVGFRNPVAQFEFIHWRTEPDGITRRASLEFSYDIDHE